MENKVMLDLALSWTVREENSFVCTSSSIPRFQTVDSGLKIFGRKCTFALHVFPPLELSRIIAAKGLIWTKARHTEGAVSRELSFRWLPHSGIAQVCLKFQVQGNFCPFSFCYATNYGVALTNVEGSVLKVKSCNSRRRYQGRTWISYISPKFFFLKYFWHFWISVSGKWGAATQRSLTLSRVLMLT